MERWCLQALLLTEWPRMLWRYRLPRFTCLCRYCSARLLRQWPRVVDVNVVSTYNYLFSLQFRSGKTKAEAELIEQELEITNKV